MLLSSTLSSNSVVMKRRLLFVAALLVIMAVQVSAQVRVGVTGGVGWNKSRISDIIEDRAPAGWNAGLTLSCKLPLGFSVQPTLQYHQKSGLLTKGLVQKMSYLELPVSVQWGPDLLVFRPFLDCTHMWVMLLATGHIQRQVLRPLRMRTIHGRASRDSNTVSDWEEVLRSGGFR